MSSEFICIEGNIGVGKTTLVKRLSAHFDCNAVYEEFEDNPWLPLFYEGVEGAALTLELSFLTDRARQLAKLNKQLLETDGIVLSDYAVDKCLLFAEINLAQQDFDRYQQLHKMLAHRLPQPTLVVCIHTEVETLLANIRVRGRDFEKMIQSTYLKKLNDSYEAYFTSAREYPVLNIFTKELNGEVYERIFSEILAFIKQGTNESNISIEL